LAVEMHVTPERRQKPQIGRRQLRPADVVAIWSQIVVIAAGVLWYQHARSHFSIGDLFTLLPICLLSLVGLIAGIVDVFTRKSGDRWWPSLIGILPGAALLLMVVALFIGISNACDITYC
jgi:hypothetical protein